MTRGAIPGFDLAMAAPGLDHPEGDVGAAARHIAVLLAMSRGVTGAITPEAPEDTGGLDDKTVALIRIGAVLATGATPTVWRHLVSDALRCRATAEEVLGVVLATAPIVGAARLVSATPSMSLAIGYDVDAALEA